VRLCSLGKQRCPKRAAPAFSHAVCQALFVISQAIGSPRWVKQNAGCFPRSASSTSAASRFSGTPRGVPFLVWFNHAVLHFKSTRSHSKPVISRVRHPLRARSGSTPTGVAAPPLTGGRPPAASTSDHVLFTGSRRTRGTPSIHCHSSRAIRRRLRMTASRRFTVAGRIPRFRCSRWLRRYACWLGRLSPSGSGRPLLCPRQCPACRQWLPRRVSRIASKWFFPSNTRTE